AVNVPVYRTGNDIRRMCLPHKWWIRVACVILSLPLLLATYFIPSPFQLWVLAAAIVVFCPVTVWLIAGVCEFFVWLGSLVAPRTIRLVLGILFCGIAVFTLAVVQRQRLALINALPWQLAANGGLVGLWLVLCAIPRHGKSEAEVINAPGRVLAWFTLC